MNIRNTIFILGFIGMAGCGGSSAPATPGPGKAGSHPSAAISAAPNPVPLGDGEKEGTTTISWTTGDGSEAQVYLAAKPGKPEELFSNGSTASKEAPWITKGGTYVFKLYAGTDHATVLASVIVTTSSK